MAFRSAPVARGNLLCASGGASPRRDESYETSGGRMKIIDSIGEADRMTIVLEQPPGWCFEWGSHSSRLQPRSRLNCLADRAMKWDVWSIVRDDPNSHLFNSQFEFPISHHMSPQRPLTNRERRLNPNHEYYRILRSLHNPHESAFMFHRDQSNKIGPMS
jgi:hypothetical protein